MKFEYDVVEVSKNPSELAEKLCLLGEDGWEVCGTYEKNIADVAIGGRKLYAILKRQLGPIKVPFTATYHSQPLNPEESTK